MIKQFFQITHQPNFKRHKHGLTGFVLVPWRWKDGCSRPTWDVLLYDLDAPCLSAGRCFNLLKLTALRKKLIPGSVDVRQEDCTECCLHSEVAFCGDVVFSAWRVSIRGEARCCDVSCHLAAWPADNGRPAPTFGLVVWVCDDVRSSMQMQTMT